MNTATAFSPYGKDLFGDPLVPDGQGPLARKFVFPPFSVLDARQGEWQARKAAWIALGIKPEGRNVSGPNCTKGKNSCMTWPMSSSEHLHPKNGEEGGGVVSIFDPVICELVYRWWCPPCGLVLDPFAGGSVRGIVAAKLGSVLI